MKDNLRNRFRHCISMVLGGIFLSIVAPTGIASAQALSPQQLEMAINAHTSAGNMSAAAELVREQLDHVSDPRFQTDLLRRLAELSEAAGDPAVAAEALAALADYLGQQQPPSGERALLLIKAGDLYANAGDGRLALEAWRQGLRIAAESGQRPLADDLAGRLEAIAQNKDVSNPADRSFLAQAKDDPDLAVEAGELAASYREIGTAADKVFNARDITRFSDKGYARVKIYYATDRAREDSELPDEFYGGRRGELEYGTATVTVPLSHEPGQIEAPSIFSFTINEDPSRHIVLTSVDPAPGKDVFAGMRAHLAASDSKEAFVFVHGFNVTFSEATKRTAQMAYDMEFQGLPILFSWPSRGSTLSYIADTAVVRLSGRRLYSVLQRVASESGASRIHLIAHSMGNRAMTDALELFALSHQGDEPVFDQVLFTAPDLDAGLFSEMVRTIRRVAARVTLYASNNDWALVVSRQLHGDSARAGQGGEEILKAEDVDSVEMSALGDDMLAHSYYANNASALTDILSLFWRDVPPEQRCGMKRTAGAKGEFWQYDPSLCDGDAMLAALRVLHRGGARTLEQARALLKKSLGPNVLETIGNERIEAALAKLYNR